MYSSRQEHQPNNPEERLAFNIPLKVFGISTIYAAALSYLERRYPIKPDHIWAEVAGGVLISLVPIAMSARKAKDLDWRLYEGTVWRSFIASGTPIILWQIGEAMFRQMELLNYTSARTHQNMEAYADDTTPLALGGRERTRGGDPLF